MLRVCKIFLRKVIFKNTETKNPLIACAQRWQEHWHFIYFFVTHFITWYRNLPLSHLFFHLSPCRSASSGAYGGWMHLLCLNMRETGKLIQFVLSKCCNKWKLFLQRRRILWQHFAFLLTNPCIAFVAFVRRALRCAICSGDKDVCHFLHSQKMNAGIVVTAGEVDVERKIQKD